MHPDLIFLNGAIYTQDEQQPTAQAIAVGQGHILAVGTNEDIEPLAGPNSERIDLNGRAMTPGLVDAHVHFQAYARTLNWVSLFDAGSLSETLQRVQAAASVTATDKWLQGIGWSLVQFGHQFPTAQDLDSVVPHQPVLLRDKSTHAAWVNSRALKVAGIHTLTPDPPGGQIQRDAGGQPTGILFESAVDLVRHKIPPLSPAALADIMDQAQALCWPLGLTGIHDFDGRDCFQALQYLHQNQQLGLRVVKNIPVKYLDAVVEAGFRSGFGDTWLRLGSVKMFADGALGPRTAAMLAPYEGEPHNLGISTLDKEEMMAKAQKASQHGLSVTVHAIGDRANHDVLDVYDVVRGSETTPAQIGLRHRIEHVQLIHPQDQARLAQLNIIASMQPVHAISDMEMADKYWGERAQHSYAWRTLLNAGTRLVFGSDAPIDDIAPWPGIVAAVTRRRADGTPGAEGWFPEQRLTIAEAIHGFTKAAAYTAGLEDVTGSISAGKLADLTIYDRDIYQLPAAELAAVKIEGTLVDGRFRFRNF